jgi:hypothetical protein
MCRRAILRLSYGEADRTQKIRVANRMNHSTGDAMEYATRNTLRQNVSVERIAYPEQVSALYHF